MDSITISPISAIIKESFCNDGSINLVLDPIATQKIEETITELKKEYTIIIVTHNMQQAVRVSDYTGFMYLGDLIEFRETKKLFTDPKNDLTAKYVQGQFG